MNLIKTALGGIASFFTGGVGVSTYIIVALVVLLGAASGGVIWQESRISDRDVSLGRIGGQLDDAIKLANQNAAAVQEEKATAARNLAAVGSSLDAALKRATSVNTIIREVARAHPEDVQPAGCPAVPAPILRAFDGVRELRSQAGDAGPDHPRPSPGLLVGVRPGPKPAR